MMRLKPMLSPPNALFLLIHSISLLILTALMLLFVSHRHRLPLSAFSALGEVFGEPMYARVV
jgi:hypothetical protein